MIERAGAKCVDDLVETGADPDTSDLDMPDSIPRAAMRSSTRDHGVGDPRVVVDDGMDVGLPQERVPVLVARLLRRLGAVLLGLAAADVAPAALGDVAELFRVDVDHRPRAVMFLASDRFARGPAHG